MSKSIDINDPNRPIEDSSKSHHGAVRVDNYWCQSAIFSTAIPTQSIDTSTSSRSTTSSSSLSSSSSSSLSENHSTMNDDDKNKKKKRTGWFERERKEFQRIVKEYADEDEKNRLEWEREKIEKEKERIKKEMNVEGESKNSEGENVEEKEVEEEEVGGMKGLLGRFMRKRKKKVLTNTLYEKGLRFVTVFCDDSKVRIC